MTNELTERERLLAQIRESLDTLAQRAEGRTDEDDYWINYGID